MSARVVTEQAEWDRRYREEVLPWDTGEVAPELLRRHEDLRRCGELERAGRVLVIGAGTGTNATWLAAQGHEVLGVDLSSSAVDLATQKATEAGLAGARFATHDWLDPIPVPRGSQDLVFDRGCFHCQDLAGRARFARRVYQALRPGGHWISLAGSADEVNEEHGPPRLSVLEVAAAVEACFEVQELRAVRFRGGTGALSWSGLFRRRRDHPPVWRD